jgi:glycogen synthase
MSPAAQRILMTTDTTGGVWNYAIGLAAELTQRGHQILLAALGPPLSLGQRQDLAEHDTLTFTWMRSKLCWMEAPWAEIEQARAWLLELEQDFRPTVVHVNTLGHAAAEWRAPVLAVGHSCVFSWFAHVRRARPPSEWARYRSEIKRGLQRSACVVAPTQAMVEDLRRHYGPLPAARAFHNGIPWAAERSDPCKSPLVIAAGRLWDEAKNLATLARVAPRLRWPVHLAGADRHPDGGRAELPNVRLLGALPHKTLLEHFQAAEVCAHPARYEPFGLTPLEAARAGCALILGDLPSLRELWEGAAIFVDPDDEDALAEALDTIIEDRDQRLALQRSARARAARYGLDATANRYEQLYATLVAGRTGRLRPAEACHR